MKTSAVVVVATRDQFLTGRMVGCVLLQSTSDVNRIGAMQNFNFKTTRGMMPDTGKLGRSYFLAW
jgi:hypothetical protein